MLGVYLVIEEQPPASSSKQSSDNRVSRMACPQGKVKVSATHDLRSISTNVKIHLLTGS